MAHTMISNHNGLLTLFNIIISLLVYVINRFRQLERTARAFIWKCCSIEKRELEKPDFKGSNEMDNTIWKHLPQDLVERCFGHLPVLTIASTMRQVNTEWRDFPGSAPFMALHNHGMNIDSSFGFLICGTNTVSRQCETMALDHNTLEWQKAPSLQEDYSKCYYHVESISEGILCVRLYDVSFPNLKRLIVWNPLLPSSCRKTIPYISGNLWSVNLVVDKEDASFKILAFSLQFRACCTYSSDTNSWVPSKHDYQGPSNILARVSFPKSTYNGGCITVSYNNCLYVAVELSRNDDLRDTHQVGVVCYDVKKNVWKPSALFTLPLRIMNRYGLIDACFTTITKALFVISDVMYMVVEYAGRWNFHGEALPPSTMQILARSLVCASNTDEWTVIATTTLPQYHWEYVQHGTWYGYILKGQEKPTICGIFESRSNFFLIMYNICSGIWKTIYMEASGGFDGHNAQCLWTMNRRKWKFVKVLNYAPSWICPVVVDLLACKHN